PLKAILGLDVPLPILTALALVPPMLTAAAPPVSMLTVLVPVEPRAKVEPPVIVNAPVLVREVLFPNETIPLPACRVRLPLVVLQVAAALEVRVRAPALVVKLEAALAASETAPVSWLSPPVTVVVIPFRPIATAEAVVLPILRVTAVAVSKVGVSKLVSALPVPPIQ